jgi:hypothetical protein
LKIARELSSVLLAQQCVEIAERAIAREFRARAHVLVLDLQEQLQMPRRRPTTRASISAPRAGRGVLIANAGRVLTHRALLREVWGPAHAERTHYLRVHMGQLRQKLEADPAQPRRILTETGVGYRLLAD